MFSPRVALVAKCILVSTLVYSGSFVAYANIDRGFITQACTKKKIHTQQVTNGTCTGQIQGNGTQTVHLYPPDKEQKKRGLGHHNEYGPCIVPEVVNNKGQGWLIKPANDTPKSQWEPSKWITKTCTPTYTCQENPAFDFANASFVATQEQPYPNAPEVNPPIFPLSKNFLKTIVFADNTAVSATADGCEYTCNDGYRLGEGACANPCVGGGGGAGWNAATAGVNITGLSATIINGGTGYTTAPRVTVQGTCTQRPTARAVISGGRVTGITLTGPIQCNTTYPTLSIVSQSTSVCRETIDNSSRDFGRGTLRDINNHPQGTNYATDSTTVNQVCKKLGYENGRVKRFQIWESPGNNTLVTLNGRGQETRHSGTRDGGKWLDDVTCFGKKVQTCTTQPVGTGAIARLKITGIGATITNGGTGYTTAPTVTVNGTCSPRPTATAVLTGTSVSAINFTGPTDCIALLPTLTIASPSGTTGGTGGTGYLSGVQVVTNTGSVTSSGNRNVTATCPANTVVLDGVCSVQTTSGGSSFNPSGYDKLINGQDFTCVARHDAGSANGNVPSQLTTKVVCGTYTSTPANNQPGITEIQKVSQEGNINQTNRTVAATCPADTVVVGGGCTTEIIPGGASFNPSGYDENIVNNTFTCIARHDSGTLNSSVNSRLTTTALCGKKEIPSATKPAFTTVQKIVQEGNVNNVNRTVAATCPANTVVVGGGCAMPNATTGVFNPSGYDESILNNTFTCLAHHDSSSTNSTVNSQLITTVLCAQKTPNGDICAGGTGTGTGGTGTGGTGGTGVTTINPPVCTVVPTFTIAPPTGAADGVRATATFVAPNTTTGLSDATITNPGSGYTQVPTVTLDGGCTNSFYPKAKAVLSATGTISQIIIDARANAQGNTASISVPATGGSITVVGKGYGYATAPTITVNAGSCTPAVPVALVSNYEVTSVTGTCVAGTDLTIAEPTGMSTCNGTPTLTISEPDGVGTGAPATVSATLGTNGGINFTVTNEGGGYTTPPAVTVTGGTCSTPVFASATIVGGKVTGVVASRTPTGSNAAIAVSNASGTIATITNPGAGYTSAPTVTVTEGTCTTRPQAVATITNGSVTGVTLTGAIGCTVAPVLTIAAPTSACTGGGTVKKCIPLVCTGTAATNKIYCENDTVIAGHEDQPHVRRADENGCTANAKCEWFCPAATPFYCEVSNTCVTSQDTCGTPVNACKTSAPSELKQEVDIPFIQCDAQSATSTDTHFRYKITKTGGAATDTYISPLYTIGTSVKHPTTFFAGTYTVTCLYGTATNTDQTATNYGMTAGTCEKTMTVNATANGCSRIYPYRGATLSDEMSSPGAFDASFRCGSRQAVTSTTDTRAYRLGIGTTQPAFLAYDRNISDLFSGIAIGPVSTQTQNYSFSSSDDVTCAAKVGDGYSTNTSCQLRTCVGGNCANPQTFIVVPSEEVSCTNGPSITYDVACNPASPDYTDCLKFLYEGTSNTRNVKVTINGVQEDRTFTCNTTTPPGALGPVKTCTIPLPTGGMPVTIFAGDASGGNNYSFQTTVYTIARDTGKPVGTIAYYTNFSNGIMLSQDQYEYWQRQPITAVITCSDKTSTNESGEKDGSNCACASSLSGAPADVDLWSLGVPNSSITIGPDVMTYSRVIMNMNNVNSAASQVRVQDTATNIGDQTFAPDFGIDSLPPKLEASKTSNSVTLTFTDNHVGASGIWKFSDTVPVGTATSPQIYKGGANNAILYRTGPKADIDKLAFGADCSPLPVRNTNYAKYRETPAAPTTQTLTLNSFDVANSVVAYCIQDNAGNINRGYYPNTMTGCFSSSDMTTIPTLSPSTLATHYAPILKTRLTTPLSTTFTNNDKYGYSFSENLSEAGCFRSILSTNITTLVTNQLTPKTTTTLNWNNDQALLKNTTTKNTNGYYYYSFTSSTNNTVTLASSPTGTGTKSVIVEGGNIQIDSNIDYTGTSKTLLLIARKNSSGQGGNIYINPSVTRIDAIIIADGGSLMNGITTSGSNTLKNWITHPTELTNRLTINGRIYSYNTRGGSLVPQTSGTDFDQVTANGNHYIPNATTGAMEFSSTATPAQAAAQDLERLRVMFADGNSQCTTRVNYQAFTTSTLPALLIKPSGFQGGNCSY